VASKKKKDAEKAKKEVCECAKLQHKKCWQGSDDEAMDDDDDDDADADEDEEEEGWDDIPWDELACDDVGPSPQPLALAQVPSSPTPAPMQQGGAVRTEAMEMDRDTSSGAPVQGGPKRQRAEETELGSGGLQMVVEDPSQGDAPAEEVLPSATLVEEGLGRAFPICSPTMRRRWRCRPIRLMHPSRGDK
jgi:hypothetical protein